MGNWLIRSKETGKAYRNSRYRQQSLSLGLRQSTWARKKAEEGHISKAEIQTSWLTGWQRSSLKLQRCSEGVLGDAVHRMCHANGPLQEGILWVQEEASPREISCLKSQGEPEVALAVKLLQEMPGGAVYEKSQYLW